MIAPFPAALAPPAPFPLVLAQSHEEMFVAPGVARATYRLMTTDGPLVINVVEADPRDPRVRIDSVVANDRMVSSGETVSSMARRTDAVAGVNADYFDIGNTNQPLNLVIRAGALLRTPSKRIVLAVNRDRSIAFTRVAFSGTVSYGTASVPLTTVNEWPPQGGAGFLTPAYGTIRPAAGVQIATLVPATSAHDTARIDGTYRVASIDPSLAAPVAGPALALGPAALAIAAPPMPGDTVSITATLSPALADLSGAVGGGPLLIAGGAVTNDSEAPAPEERDRRFPVSGAGTTAAGMLLLASVDGRQNDLSIGLTRPQFAALWLALGATDAMAFDSGGSAELVARVLGDANVSVLGSPSDGEERNVADGLFIYSEAARGPAARLVVRPQAIVALPDVELPVTLALTDAAGHPLGLVHADGGDDVRVGRTSRVAILRAGRLTSRVPIDVVDRPAALALVSDSDDAQPGDVVHLTVRAFDRSGRAIAFGDQVRYSTDAGHFVAPGALHVDAHDADVSATIAGITARTHVFVGSTRIALDPFATSGAPIWRFATVPAAGVGSLALENDALRLSYDFSHGGRIAYADTDVPLPGNPERVTIEVSGDGSGVGLRAAFVNRFGERRALTLAKAVTWTGWQLETIPLPRDLNAPVHLVSLYAVDGLGGTPTRSVGAFAFRNLAVIVAGTP